MPDDIPHEPLPVPLERDAIHPERMTLETGDGRDLRRCGDTCPEIAAIAMQLVHICYLPIGNR